jgi:hypothetical protein
LKGFIRSHGIPPSQALLGAIFRLSAVTTRTGTIGITTPHGKTITLEAEAGDVGFQAAGVIHDEHSMSDPARTAMVIELKD